MASGQGENQQLSLKNTAWQSFYVPEDKQLQDVFLMSGENRLRINLARLHTGTSPYTRYDITSLTPNFILDKHENRELVNFNALGTGLYEKFDTLYVTLLNQRGATVSRADINVERVDAEGHRLYDADVRYVGYDSKKKAHAILTQGHPVYFEVLATGYLPTIYKYPGAADPITHIVSEELCNVTIMLESGKVDDSGFALTQQNLYTLKDEKFIVVRSGIDYCYCSEETTDMESYVATDTLYYVEDAGHNYPKLFMNRPTERYAQMGLVYSRPAGGDALQSTLTGIEEASGESHTIPGCSLEVVSPNEFPTFTRNYYFQRHDLVGAVPVNTPYNLVLTSDAFQYKKFPLMINFWFDREQSKKDAGSEVNDNVARDQSEESKNTMKACDYDISVPINFKFSFNPLKVSTTVDFDATHRRVDFKVVGNYNQAAGKKDDDDEAMSAQRKEVQAAAGYGYANWKEGDDSKKFNVGQKSIPLKNKLADEAEDIFNISPALGAGWYGGFRVAMRRNLGDFDHESNFVLTEASGNVGYAFNVCFPDLVEKYIGSGTFGKMLKKVPLLNIGGLFGASAGLNFGIKSFDPSATMTAQNMGIFTNFEVMLKAGVWAQLTIPSNPVLCGSAGVRAGVKGAIRAGVAVPFSFDNVGLGVEFFGMGVIEGFIHLRTFCFQWSGKVGWYPGGSKLLPDDASNPFHEKFPGWLSSSKARTICESYRAPRRVEASTLGETLLTDVAIDANPHFIDENTVVVNHLGQADDYNDDYVATVDLTTHELTNLSGSGGTPAHNHMRSKHGNHEVVVYEEATQPIDAASLNDDNAAQQSADVNNHTRIMSAFRQNDGTWQVVPVFDDGRSNTKPIVTIQDDGKAACVWQNGINECFDPVTPSDSIYPYDLHGTMMLSTYDGTQWSTPRQFYTLSHEYASKQYDLVMRGDTVLIGYLDDYMPHREEMRASLLRYVSVPINGDEMKTVTEQIVPERIFMNRVGHHAVIAMMYEKTDSLKDIFVKTLNMDGTDEGCVGNNVGASFSQPSLLKIVCDRSAEDIDDFAILWTEVNNVVREDDGTLSTADNMKGMINASRVHLSNNALCVTAPITLGGDQNDLIVTDFDGVLDDSRIRVVYSLADPETGGAVVMTNEKEFINSFESDVTYTREALIASNVLPVNVTVRNTGTSAIQSVTATINGEDFDIADSYVAPLRGQTFIVPYPVSDDFDGYMTTHVSVVFDNVFKAKAHSRHRAKSFVRQTKAMPATHITATENVSLRLLDQSIEDGRNTFVVELTDESMRGIATNHAVAVGLYSHPSILEPLSDESVVTVAASDFMEIGGKRKAFATITMSGVTQPIQAYLTTHIVDATKYVGAGLLGSDGESMEAAHVDNVAGSDNAYSVKLYPTDDQTALRRILSDAPIEHRIMVKPLERGVELSGLQLGEHIRLFNADGMLIFNKTADRTTLFVPLPQHHIYLLTGNNEVLKFAF